MFLLNFINLLTTNLRNLLSIIVYTKGFSVTLNILKFCCVTWNHEGSFISIIAAVTRIMYGIHDIMNTTQIALTVVMAVLLCVADRLLLKMKVTPKQHRFSIIVVIIGIIASATKENNTMARWLYTTSVTQLKNCAL